MQSIFIGDFFDVYGKKFESMFGTKWSEHIRNLLVNNIANVFPKQQDGCTLYFINVLKFREELFAVRKSENIERILHKLNIVPENMKPYNCGLDNKAKLSFNR